MGNIADSANESFSDYNTQNDPSSGLKKPDKSEIRGTFQVVEDTVVAGDDGLQSQVTNLNARTTVLEATAGAPGLNFDTLAHLNASSPPAVNTVAFVNFDPTLNNNGKYIFSATSPASWQKTNDRVDAETERAEAAEDVISARAVLVTRQSRVRIGFDGDSIWQRNLVAGLTSGTMIYTSANGEFSWAHAAWPHFEWDCWPDGSVSVGEKYATGMNFAVSGSVTTDLIARIGANLLFAPEIMAISIGINDIIAGTLTATIIANIETICSAYLARGIRVILTTVRPTQAPCTASSSDIIALNTAIRTYATATPGITLWDVYTIYNSGAGVPYAGYLQTSDGIHPIQLGAMTAGIFGANGVPALSDVLRSMCKAQPLLLPPNSQNLILNPQFLTATGGTAGTGVTAGSVPALWFAGVNGSGGTTFEISTFPNGNDQGNAIALAIICNGGGANSEQIQFQQLTRFDLSDYVGKWVQIRGHFTITGANLIRSVLFQVDPGLLCMDANSLTVDDIPPNLNLTFESKMVQVPVTPTGFLAAWYIYTDGTKTGTCTVNLLASEVMVFDDPLYMHGQEL